MKVNWFVPERSIVRLKGYVHCSRIGDRSVSFAYSQGPSKLTCWCEAPKDQAFYTPPLIRGRGVPGEIEVELYQDPDPLVKIRLPDGTICEVLRSRLRLTEDDDLGIYADPDWNWVWDDEDDDYIDWPH